VLSDRSVEARCRSPDGSEEDSGIDDVIWPCAANGRSLGNERERVYRLVEWGRELDRVCFLGLDVEGRKRERRNDVVSASESDGEMVRDLILSLCVG
jgi:hypothetical protein